MCDLDGFGADLLRRARWARDHNGGQPDAAWSTGEFLIVALILGDQATLDGMNYTRPEVESRLMGDLRYYGYLGDVGAWLDQIRMELANG